MVRGVELAPGKCGGSKLYCFALLYSKLHFYLQRDGLGLRLRRLFVCAKTNILIYLQNSFTDFVTVERRFNQESESRNLFNSLEIISAFLAFFLNSVNYILYGHVASFIKDGQGSSLTNAGLKLGSSFRLSLRDRSR